MRQLVLLRGAPGCGKSTWIEQMGFKDYALSADQFRLCVSSPIMDANGNMSIDQNTNKDAWDMLFKALEIRMEKGDFTVIDACNTKKVEMSRYKDLAQQYKYRLFVVDFTDIPIETVKQQNRLREPAYKRVPESVIDLAYSRFKTQGIPGGFTVIKPSQAKKIFLSEFDFSHFRNVYVIGDIHGCYTALMAFFNEIAPGGISDEDFYIFTGDYIDRGIENSEVVKWMLENKDRKNFLFLTGNHEKWLEMWSNGEKARSKGSGIDKKEVRKLCRKFGQCAYFKFHDNRYFISHGGVSKFSDLIPTFQLIKGVGDYENVNKVVDSWAKNTDDSFYQVFGHRNVDEYKIDELKDKRSFLLEGRVEFGGHLRAIRISESAGCVCVDPIYIKNDVYNKQYDKITTTEVEELNVSDFVETARNSKFIVEKKFEDNISSFNFTREAFEKGKWNNLTVTARGLYIDTEKNSIIIRGYSKFWNVNEREETSLPFLRKNLKFPVKAYLKENGFLGLLSVKDDDFILSTKSRLNGIHKEWFEDIFYKTISSEGGLNLFNFLKENNATALFEVIDIENDPHIISYESNKIVLLDIVKNSLKFEKVLSYKELKKKSLEEFHLNCKELIYEFNNFEELLDFYNDSQKESWNFNGDYIEGVVFEDSCGYMTKLKTGYYQEWKHLRSISEEVFNKGYSEKTSSLLTPLKNEFYAWLKSKVVNTNKEQRQEMKKSIIELRNEFINQNK